VIRTHGDQNSIVCISTFSPAMGKPLHSSWLVCHYIVRICHYIVRDSYVITYFLHFCFFPCYGIVYFKTWIYLYTHIFTNDWRRMEWRCRKVCVCSSVEEILESRLHSRFKKFWKVGCIVVLYGRIYSMLMFWELLGGGWSGDAGKCVCVAARCSGVHARGIQHGGEESSVYTYESRTM